MMLFFLFLCTLTILWNPVVVALLPTSQRLSARLCNVDAKKRSELVSSDLYHVGAQGLHVAQLQRLISRNSVNFHPRGFSKRFKMKLKAQRDDEGNEINDDDDSEQGNEDADESEHIDENLSSSTIITPLTSTGDSHVQTIELNDELKSSFMSYAMSTILGRALPDARDGLKPVHRRVLFAMQCLGLTPDSTYRKCARVVGEVLGKFHPHGDQSVYDALVRMAQDFVTLHPLVAGHGNFGSVDNDPPAAMRYTEAKLSSVAYDSLLSEIKEDTVDFIQNFDGNEMEPVVLPAKLPMLLLNGASGIAVGMATNIPPHNLGELCSAIVAIIENKNLSDEELFKIIPAPDFPTGGRIMGVEEARKMYNTGHGSVIMRADTHVEVLSQVSKGVTRTKNAIIVTSLPYLTNKASLLEKIADLVNDKKLDGISDLRDESDRDGIRIVIELKRDAVPNVVQNNLFKKTALQTTFSGNMLALVDEGKQPQRITLRQALDLFIDFRFKTLRRRTDFQLKKVVARDHIVQGLLIALSHIDEIIELIRTNKDHKEILLKAVNPESPSQGFGLSEEQVEAILGLRLGRLTSMEESKLKEEHNLLTAQIDSLTKVMNDDSLVFEIMKNETMELKEKYGVPRKSSIWGAEAPLSDMDLLANERSVIIITQSGYIKRLPVEEFQAQSRGGRGKSGTKLSTEDDSVSQFFTCNDHDALLFVTERGVAYSIKAFQIPKGSRYAKGVPLPQVLPIGAEEITSVIPIDSFGADKHLVLLTKHGFVKKTPLKAFESITARGLIIISLEDKDSLRWARCCDANNEIVIATKDGFASRFSVSDVTSTSRTSRGVRALKLREGDEMADMDIFRPEGVNVTTDNKMDETSLSDASANRTLSTSKNSNLQLLAVTEKGYGKRILIDEFSLQRRRGKGSTAIRFKDKAGGGGKASREGGQERNKDADALRCMRVCRPGDEVVLSTLKGTVIRQRVEDLSIQSRRGTGVLIQKIEKNDRIIMFDVIPASAIANSSSSRASSITNSEN